jgi:hypothetical protein
MRMHYIVITHNHDVNPQKMNYVQVDWARLDNKSSPRNYGGGVLNPGWGNPPRNFVSPTKNCWDQVT